MVRESEGVRGLLNHAIMMSINKHNAAQIDNTEIVVLNASRWKIMASETIHPFI